MLDVLANPLVALGIIIVVMVGIAIAAAVLSAGQRAKQNAEERRALPQGSDSSSFGRMLQAKYQQERDSGEHKRQEF